MNGFTIWMIVINTSFWLICCFGTAHLVRFLPKSWYEKNQWFFAERSFERKVYKRIGLDRWKDRLPECGKVWNFQKKNLNEDLTLSYADKFILETKYAEVGHLGMAVLGFACIWVNPSDYALMAFILAGVNVIVQIPFCLIQRYNRPRLLRLRSRLARKSRESYTNTNNPQTGSDI
ncbi:glycosyl-4,4'-diaponeurosporenoate acyltransferase CrtO family protein [Saccharibacillus kuerlensis]|uniref:Glycosyl-4,4'-diaponeurosporenoate acyltransferase n=1 Tax=Saccharibacillus kuerlensis TaxID=459527 RepID=A0ABQ2L504_9BACL|nr:hypothetical protein [Saccharibacillus kuerlensis]GGO00192.1 hypothetical protein GCM10010969_21080 [Saccharibacillus kuerlensis]